jgi:predicted enzyme related to lactoylglutathione lyase
MPTITPVISTPDLPRLRAFYEGLVGASEAERFPADGDVFFLGLTAGDSALGLVSEAETDPGTGGQRMMLNIVVDDVDTLLDRVTALGGTVLSPPNDMPWGQRVGHVQDPDGNAVNLMQDL